jgi:hypothetical protein
LTKTVALGDGTLGVCYSECTFGTEATKAPVTLPALTKGHAFG